MILTFAAFLIIIFYIIHISAYISGFLKIKSFSEELHHPKFEDKIYISVLVAFKNEEENLPTLLSSLNLQTLNKNLYELIFVNDHSIDKSEKIIKSNYKNTPNFQYITQEQNRFGKKEALLTAFKTAKGELIVTTDADCQSGAFWLETILKYYLKFRPKMIIGPVFINGKSTFENFQSLEFASLQGSTAGSAGINKPIMCNGANLAYRKEVVTENNDILHAAEQSGDDVFLLHHIKKTFPKEIHFLKSLSAVVNTKPEKKFSSFCRQRFRWASKSKSYKDFDIIFTSLLVLILNIVIILLFSLSFTKLIYLITGILLFIFKSIIDLIILKKTLKFFKRKDLLKYFFPLSILYPFYIVITATVSIFIKKIKWK